MELKTLTLELPKETLEMGEAIQNILIATATALKDGWQPGTDVPVVITATIANLGTAVAGAQNIPAEFGEAPGDASLALIAPIAKGVASFFAK
jgi:hypothetical protein